MIYIYDIYIQLLPAPETGQSSVGSCYSNQLVCLYVFKDPQRENRVPGSVTWLVASV